VKEVKEIKEVEETKDEPKARTCACTDNKVRRDAAVEVLR
jgi:hypothetical protein